MLGLLMISSMAFWFRAFTCSERAPNAPDKNAAPIDRLPLLLVCTLLNPPPDWEMLVCTSAWLIISPTLANPDTNPILYPSQIFLPLYRDTDWRLRGSHLLPRVRSLPWIPGIQYRL